MSHIAALAVAVAAALLTSAEAPARAVSAPVGHVFVVLLENKSYSDTFGAGSKAPYLSGTLRRSGQLLSQYHAIGHLSLPNYLALVSGQAPNPQTQADCRPFTDFVGLPALDADGQAVGQGCVFPPQVKTIADQLTAKGLSWKGYMEDMGTACRRPALNGADDTQQAERGDCTRRATTRSCTSIRSSTRRRARATTSRSRACRAISRRSRTPRTSR